jgi:hypothetical protein
MVVGISYVIAFLSSLSTSKSEPKNGDINSSVRGMFLA